MIHHVTTQQAWTSQKNNSEFIPGEYARDGFIHCCTPLQLAGVLERYFKGKQELVLFHIDESLLQSELKYEQSTNDELFPHLYGGINRSAILKVVML
jgi:uncharacterized protein (DUF952 family)